MIAGGDVSFERLIFSSHIQKLNTEICAVVDIGSLIEIRQAAEIVNLYTAGPLQINTYYVSVVQNVYALINNTILL